MARHPTIDVKLDKEVARLRKLLADLERIPAHRREDECADVREETIRAMLEELVKAPVPHQNPLLTWEQAQPYLNAPKPLPGLELDRWHYARTLAAIEDVKASASLSDEQRSAKIKDHEDLLAIIEEYVATARPQ